jgi:hypothetical protein
MIYLETKKSFPKTEVLYRPPIYSLEIYSSTKNFLGLARDLQTDLSVLAEDLAIFFRGIFNQGILISRNFFSKEIFFQEISYQGILLPRNASCKEFFFRGISPRNFLASILSIFFRFPYYLFLRIVDIFQLYKKTQ